MVIRKAEKFSLMKELFVLLVIGLSLLFASCAQQSDIANLQSQIDELKSGRIASIESQISSITASISALQEADREIKGYITALQNTASELQKSINTTNGKIDELEKALALVNTAIETLQAKDSALEKRIDELKDYVDTQLKNAKDWVSATFATLDQYNGIVSEIGGLRGSISSINTAMEQMESRLNGKTESTKTEIESAYTKAMGTLETSLKNWVNEQLKGYLTIAETEAKLAALKGSLEREDESIREDINKLSASLDSAKTELTEGYKVAIRKAIDENNGVIDGKISEVVSGLNTRIDNEVSTINKRLDAIEKRVANLETQVSALVSRIQSLTYIPRYTDGASTMWVKLNREGSYGEARDTLEFRVSPADCADSLVKVWDKAISAEAVTLATRATQETVSLPVVSVSGDNGKISVVLDGDPLGERFFTGERQMKAVVVISDGNNERTSEYVSMVAKEDPTLPNNIIRYTSSDGKIVVPRNNWEFGATIVSNKYENGRGIILFDRDITSIGWSAFYQCTSLTSIQIPNSVVSILDIAFAGCTGLTSIQIPDSVTSIRNGAFWGCSGLTSIWIPKSVTNMAEDLIYECENISSITVDSGNPVYDSRNNCNAIIETKSNSLVVGCKNTIIPDSVTSIWNGAFAGCSGLTSVWIPKSVTNIERNPFFYCENITSITVDPSNTVYDSRNNCNAIIETKSNSLVTGCRNTIIPDSITRINDYAFYLCSSLTSIVIPNSVVSIWDNAFAGCTGLISIDLPNSITSIGRMAFHSCEGLSSIIIRSTTPFSLYDGVFYFTNDCPIYVPAESVDNYKTNPYWSSYASRIQAIPSGT